MKNIQNKIITGLLATGLLAAYGQDIRNVAIFAEDGNNGRIQFADFTNNGNGTFVSNVGDINGNSALQISADGKSVYYVSTTQAGTIRSIDRNGNRSNIFTDASLVGGQRFQVAGNGDIYWATNGQIKKFDSGTSTVSTFTSNSNIVAGADISVTDNFLFYATGSLTTSDIFRADLATGTGSAWGNDFNQFYGGLTASDDDSVWYARNPSSGVLYEDNGAGGRIARYNQVAFNDSQLQDYNSVTNTIVNFRADKTGFQLYQLDGSGNSATFTLSGATPNLVDFDTGNLDFTTTVPETKAYALFVAFISALAVIVRRRK